MNVMKAFYSFVASAMVLVNLSAPVVFAHEEDEAETTATTTTTTREERQQARKEKFSIKLEAKEENSLKGKCRSVQVRLANIQRQIGTLQTVRFRVYSNIQTHLEKLVEKLDARGADTTTLKANIEELHTMVDAFNTDVEEVKVAIDDMIAMDCEADPTGFKAALEEARASHVALKKQSTQIRTYIHETIKQTIKTIRESLEQTTETESETETETEGEQ